MSDTRKKLLTRLRRFTNSLLKPSNAITRNGRRLAALGKQTEREKEIAVLKANESEREEQ